MDLQLNVFNSPEFGEVRWVNIKNKDYAVASDVARALGYAENGLRTTIKRTCVNVTKCNVHTTRGQLRVTSVIPEGDIYRLIVGSTLLIAEKFERWVFDEVLPQIRKIGGYIPIVSQETDEELFARTLVIANNTLDLKDKRLKKMETKLVV